MFYVFVLCLKTLKEKKKTRILPPRQERGGVSFSGKFNAIVLNLLDSVNIVFNLTEKNSQFYERKTQIFPEISLPLICKKKVQSPVYEIIRF